MRALIVALGVVLTIPPASAHYAQSGWKYNAYCCSEKDCRELSDDEVEVTPEGWVVRTPELTTTVPYGSNKVKWSPDGRYHGCFGEPGGYQGGSRQSGVFLRCFYATRMAG